jgi:hypothetical protein
MVDVFRTNLRDNNCVSRLQQHILLGMLPLYYVVVVEGKSNLIGASSAKNVDFLSLGKIFQAAGLGNNLQDRG